MVKKATARTIKGFQAAWAGLKETLIKEISFKIMAAAAITVLFLMFIFPTSRAEKISLLLMIFAVLGIELVNSAIERFLNLINPAADEKVRIIKDLMAAIVLVASLGAAIIGIIIFWPYLFGWFQARIF